MDIRSTVRLQDRSKEISDGWWAWSMWVEGPPESLDRIESVRYTLHHTFPDPVRVIHDRGSKFALDSSGWGEFTVHAQVSTKDGDAFPLQRWLTLEGSDPSESSLPGKPSGEKSADSSRRPKVFLSYSATDTPTVRLLQEELGRQGIDVVSPEALPSGSSWQEGIRASIDSADAVAFLTSGELRGFAENEVSAAQKLGKPMIPIIIGKGTAPVQFIQLEVLRLDSDDQVGAVADALSARVKDEFFAEE